MQIRIHFHDKSSELIASAPRNQPCTRDKIRSLLRRQGCQLLEFLDAGGKVVLSVKASN